MLCCCRRFIYEPSLKILLLKTGLQVGLEYFDADSPHFAWPEADPLTPASHRPSTAFVMSISDLVMNWFTHLFHRNW